MWILDKKTMTWFTTTHAVQVIEGNYQNAWFGTVYLRGKGILFGNALEHTCSLEFRSTCIWGVIRSSRGWPSQGLVGEAAWTIPSTSCPNEVWIVLSCFTDAYTSKCYQSTRSNYMIAQFVNALRNICSIAGALIVEKHRSMAFAWRTQHAFIHRDLTRQCSKHRNLTRSARPSNTSLSAVSFVQSDPRTQTTRYNWTDTPEAIDLKCPFSNTP